MAAAGACSFMGRFRARPAAGDATGLRRPGVRMAAGLAASAVAHAALLAWITQAPSAHKPPRPLPTASRAVVVQVMPSVARRIEPSAVSAAAPLEGQRPAAPRRVVKAPAPAVPVPQAPAKPVPAVAEAAPPAPPREAISGVAFGMPRIGLGFKTTPTRWVTPPASAFAPTLTAAAPPPPAHTQGGRDARRAQVAQALSRLAQAWPAPDAAVEGACTLRSEPEPALDCDDDALKNAIGGQASPLSGLLQAYRDTEPATTSLRITFAQGRYGVSPMQADDRR